MLARALTEKYLQGIDILLIAPDGDASLIPFGALVDKGGRHLIERYEITYLTSGRDLLRTKSDSASSPALVLGAPEFDVAVSEMAPVSDDHWRRSGELGSMKWDPIPGTRDEALSIAKMLGVAALTGTDATETAVRTAQAPRVLHIATHGFFLIDQDDENRAGERLGSRPMGIGSNPIFGRPLSMENPMLRSGLALAGANVAKTSADDGYLTALEMAGLDLWGTQLVVLSACETAVGQVSLGDGVYGMRRALVIAGAESQVVSLWRVDDAATKGLMVAYYKRLRAGEGRSEALRNVQLAMLADPARQHPFYWASFIPIGERGPIDFSKPATEPE